MDYWRQEPKFNQAESRPNLHLATLLIWVISLNLLACSIASLYMSSRFHVISYI